MDDSGSHPLDDEDRWNRLTEKQRVCLDLLIEHKTSKEIARLLDISKHTVDQRLTTARVTLGASDRNALAFTYQRLKQTCDRVTYDAVGIPPGPTLVRSEFPDGSPPNLMELRDSSQMRGGLSSNRSPFGDLLRPDHSSVVRIGITLTVVGVIVLISLGGLSIGQTLTELLTR
jgi:DNA-binding CsgD family transcriptional regulator